MTGRIIKGIAGFYYVSTAGSGIYECKAKGIFRKDRQKPLIGDRVEVEILDEQDREGSITAILPRDNALIRPAVANVDQAMVFFALKDPDPSGALLDRFLVMMEKQQVPVFVCFNKTDLADDETIGRWREIYASCGYRVCMISAAEEGGTDEVMRLLRGKTTVVAGPSGAGKSTFTNLVQDRIRMETGEISRKLKRGKNTTRHSELVQIDEETFFCDTPGFTSLELPEMEPEELERYFPEFRPYMAQCRFVGCSHVHEPDCAVREALEEGLICKERYQNYRLFYEQLRERKQRRY